MSEIEAEIRRQMLEQRDRALREQANSPTANGELIGENMPPVASAPPPTPSFHALPPPAFPNTGSQYPPHYPQPAYTPLSFEKEPLRVAPPPPPIPAAAPKAPPRQGIWGALGAIGVTLAKFGGALKFLVYGKYLLTAGSMLLSVAALTAYSGGWRFPVGLVFMIFVHEMGHVFAVKRLGHEVKAMIFIPFMGAFVSHNQVRSATESAQIAIMGPVAGTLAGLAFGAVYAMTGSIFWLGLAWVSFLINLFNLCAMPFLDGSHVTPLIPAKVLLGGLLATALINAGYPIVWLLPLFALPEIVARWKVGVDPALKVTPQEQKHYTLAYFGLVLFLGIATRTTQDWLWTLKHLAGSRYH